MRRLGPKIIYSTLMQESPDSTTRLSRPSLPRKRTPSSLWAMPRFESTIKGTSTATLPTKSGNIGRVETASYICNELDASTKCTYCRDLRCNKNSFLRQPTRASKVSIGKNRRRSATIPTFVQTSESKFRVSSFPASLVYVQQTTYISLLSSLHSGLAERFAYNTKSHLCEGSSCCSIRVRASRRQ